MPVSSDNLCIDRKLQLLDCSEFQENSFLLSALAQPYTSTRWYHALIGPRFWWSSVDMQIVSTCYRLIYIRREMARWLTSSTGWTESSFKSILKAVMQLYWTSLAQLNWKCRRRIRSSSDRLMPYFLDSRIKVEATLAPAFRPSQ